MNRRAWLATMGSGMMMLSTRAALGQTSKLEAVRREWRDFLPEGLDVPRSSDKVERTEDEWRTVLSPLAFRVLREEDTEPAGSSALNDEHRPGVYVCAGCNLPLFTSEMKFESGTGWPSFYTTIPDVFETKRDFVFLILRTEYHCVRCGGHHGHVFDDGPPPTHERWCNNGAALRFIPRA